MIELFDKLWKALEEHRIDEIGLLPFTPDIDQLPFESQEFHPLVVIESKLGIAKPELAVLLKQAHGRFIALDQNDSKQLEKVTRIMILLKPDNYTAMNKRKQLLLSNHIDPKQELALIELIFTIPRHAKSSIAWYHRQWILTQFAQEMDIEKELKLAKVSSAAYPRNYYAWTYRTWILLSHCSLPRAQQEYDQTCCWIELNISDFSGLQYLQRIIQYLKIKDYRRHMEWLDQLIIKYPGYESLWCHRRFCSYLFVSSTEYCDSQHAFIHGIVSDQFKDQSLSDSKSDFDLQKEYALKFGTWQTMMEKRYFGHSLASQSTVDLYKTKAPF
ncbi:uncharacterized protein B0P05DRAFT_530420 [Gilbertella persicaria]|uniref:uncharacterized protein n=1 Tax=Gilbertella persicaria TaxID=101096 RepID=UPI0022206124|nr:uncharacterized protein B0P05DRAFT_530420 [Gilbertella persicaria]KAI8087856.1 hypothetical protein B0P05DRAFT_530420 [Gilbertella persicaria]